MMGGQFLEESFFNPDSLVLNGLCPSFASLDFPAQAADVYFVPEVRNFYLGSVGLGTDLAATSIQMGRDLGALRTSFILLKLFLSYLPAYKELVKSLGYYPVYTFSDITQNPTITGKMSTAYHNALGEVDACDA